MNWLVPALALAFFADPPAAAPTPRPAAPALQWGWFSEPEGEYVCTGKGAALSPEGATVEIHSRSAAPQGNGGRGARFDAAPYRRLVVTVSTEIRTRGVSGAAFLFLRIEKDGAILENERSFGNALRGDTDWTPRSASFRVPPYATKIYFGVVLVGAGEVSARHLRVEGVDRPRPESPPSVSPALELEVAIRMVRWNALRRDAVDWARVEPEICSLAEGAEESSDVHPAIRLLLSKLGEGHSRFLSPDEFSGAISGGAGNPPAEVRALPGNVAYLRIPGYWGWDVAAAEEFAQRAFDAIDVVRKEARCGWVVDLRDDTGGNLRPMIATLEPFLGEETLGCFEGGAGPAWAWSARTVSDTPPPAALGTLRSARVAVLTGPRTLSSGEAVAIAFRGRPSTRSFGEPTGGLSTSCSFFPLPDGAAILLAVTVMADRTGRWYGGPIEPDVRIEIPPGTAEDLALAEAVKWLRESSGCAGTK